MVDIINQNRQLPELPEPPKARRQLDNKAIRASVYEVVANELFNHMGGVALDELITQQGGSEADYDAAIRQMMRLVEELRRRADRARGEQ